MLAKDIMHTGSFSRPTRKEYSFPERSVNTFTIEMLYKPVDLNIDQRLTFQTAAGVIRIDQRPK